MWSKFTIVCYTLLNTDKKVNGITKSPNMYNTVPNHDAKKNDILSDNTALN